MPPTRPSSSSTEVRKEQPSPDVHVKVHCRRSARQAATNEASPEPPTKKTTKRNTRSLNAESKSGPGFGLKGHFENSKLDPNSKQAHDEKMLARKGVQGALESLAQMEQRLVRATKRQKAKVEESDLASVAPDKEEDTAMKPGLDPIPARGVRARRAKAAVAETLSPDTGHIDDPDYDEGAEEVNDDLDELSGQVAERGAARPPAVNSPYLPLPWKGRLGYACLNTYLRTAVPPVFSSRTCRMASVIEHRYPLVDPTMPEHATKNRPDKTQDQDLALGFKFMHDLGLANARDIVKMLRWNDKYGIKFMRLSSEMFPFASHAEHGYKLAPFASEVLAEAGKVAAELGHRLTTHPGQYTQLGSPRNEVIKAAVRDLEYHDELLSLLKLPEQQDRDAVMILHLGGVFGDKAATLDRFRKNYTTLLSPSIKRRLVLENDDVSWSVHELLPICEELNIPMVLDFHHHNIVFDSDQVREGTMDISQPELMERIAATWRRKGIRQKMHYSEPCPGMVTPRDRRKHSPRVATLPPCTNDMDLMIEAKDKEQAVFELMRNFKLPGYERINDMIPYVREDQNRPVTTQTKGKKKMEARKRKRKSDDDDPEADKEADAEGLAEALADEVHVAPEDIGMGGRQGRVYWPIGMEEWLKPMKKIIKKKEKPEVRDKAAK